MRVGSAEENGNEMGTVSVSASVIQSMHVNDKKVTP